ncbi:hypothetical protein PtA15_13A403 [Puccinia triticina]|uniref:Uncharacterized protein n=1 Tax=Puccinia triticina TaxID=208348 RepID=A0ABY7D326_9BASI|nr:uncharacterized protein PtA15_13A403 [Puccinia triticina]WAQ91003.1 hypothetical protein PtA15_13A403 [Puccinia triticina]WAR61193.1 hypothetical protein PtB15_13B445 [Puccinia triticina]
MKSIFGHSCHARPARWVLVGHLALLFLLNFKPASADKATELEEVLRAPANGFRGAQLDKNEINKIPDAKNPLLQHEKDPLLEHQKDPPLESHADADPSSLPTFLPKEKSEPKKNIFIRFWRWLIGSHKTERPPLGIPGAPDPRLEEYHPNQPWWSRFWKWLTESVPDRRLRPSAFPKIDELTEPFIPPWERWGSMKYHPRTPTDTREHFVVTMRVLGDKLREDPSEAKHMWNEALMKAGGTPLRRKILSTDLFFQLCERLSKQEEKGAKFVNMNIEIGKAGNRIFKGEGYLKEELKSIVDRFQPGYAHGVTGTKWDPDFYRRPLSPLLLLVDRPELSPRLSKYAKWYRKGVDLFESLKETVAALKDYYAESEKLSIAHENYEDEVLYYFNHLDQIDDRNFMTDITREGLSNEELEKIKKKAGQGNTEAPPAAQGHPESASAAAQGHPGSEPAAQEHSGSEPAAQGHPGSEPAAQGHSGSEPAAQGHPGSEPAAQGHPESEPAAHEHTGSAPDSQGNTGSAPASQGHPK